MVPTAYLFKKERHFILYVIQRYPRHTSAPRLATSVLLLTSKELCGDRHSRISIDSRHPAPIRVNRKGKRKRKMT